MSKWCYVYRPYTYSTHISICIQGHCEHESTNKNVLNIREKLPYKRDECLEKLKTAFAGTFLKIHLCWCFP